MNYRIPIAKNNWGVIEYGFPEEIKEFRTLDEAKRYIENKGAADEFFIINLNTRRTLDYYNGTWLPSDDPIGL